MPDYTIFDTATGLHVLNLTMPDLAQAELNAQAGQTVVEGYYTEDFWLNGGSPAALPPKPEEWLVWSGTAWVDPRTETDRFNQLHQARLAASIPMSELFIRLAQYGAFPMAEVANYEFPPTVDEFLELPAFTTAQHDLIKGGLKSWATISRAETRIFGPIHPDDPGDGLPYFIPWLASAKGVTITAAQADEMFDVAVPPPLYTAP